MGTDMLSRRRARRAVGLVATVVLIATACGSTVSVQGDGALISDGLGLDGGFADTPPGAQLDPANPDRSSTSEDRSGLSAAGGQLPGRTSSSGLPRQSGTTTPPAKSPGVRGDQVSIGYTTARDSSAASNSLGIEGAETGNVDAQVRAVVQDINGRGGLLGRKIVLVNHDVKSLSATQDPARTSQEACAKFTQDNKVFAVLDTIGMGDDSFRDCLVKHRTALISDWMQSDEAEFDRTGIVFSPSQMTVDRYLPAVVDRLVAQGFFTKWDVRAGRLGAAPVKIGLTHFDNEKGNRYAAVLKRALAKHRLTVAEEASYSPSLNDNSSSTSNAVLRFNAAGVTHMFNANLLFYKNADSQNYHPRYAIDDYIATPYLLSRNVGKSQLHGAIGAGYRPLDEVPKASDPTPAATRCKELMRKSGQDTSKQFTVSVMLSVCDVFNLLEAGIRAGRDVSAAALVNGIESLGTRFQPTVTYRSIFNRGRHAGGSGVRDFVYSDACGCFKFPDSKIHPVP